VQALDAARPRPSAPREFRFPRLAAVIRLARFGASARSARVRRTYDRIMTENP
jgi:hypothetical protein